MRNLYPFVLAEGRLAEARLLLKRAHGDVGIANPKVKCFASIATSVSVTLLISAAILPDCSPACAEGVREKAVLPLKVSDTGRFLVDQKNTPFLVVGDTPWSLIVQPPDKEIDHYLTDRANRGFNSIIVNLIEHKFCTEPPKTRSGLSPFEQAGDFSTPNRQYFDFAHQVVQKANERGIVVWLSRRQGEASGVWEVCRRAIQGPAQYCLVVGRRLHAAESRSVDGHGAGSGHSGTGHQPPDDSPRRA